MADALISMLVERLGSTTFEYIDGEVELVLNVNKEVEKFAEHLKAIQDVLQDAEQRKVTEDGVRIWLDKLKQISFEMVDVLDEWNTDMLRKQVEKQKREGDQNALVPKKKVLSSFSPNCFCFGQVSRVFLRRDIACKIKDLNERIKDLKERLTEIDGLRRLCEFQRRELGIHQLPERQQTSSFVDTSKIFGREKETDILIKNLLSDDSEEGKGILIIPIVGMGGMGKTTLTQLAYNDEKVQSHFEKRIWICVSDPFDEIRIAKAISGDDAPSSNELNYVLECMSRSVKGKRFLLVLDDVWTENHKKWEQLEVPLIQSGAKGSRILVTTRKLEVVVMMRARDHMISLKELSEEICLSIFNHLAFSDRKFDESEVFRAIGEEIVKKCKGLPLAAKTLGSLMRDKRTHKEWKSVLNSKIWDIEKVEQEVFQPLLLSYYDLAPTVKCCLLYCVVFPKDHEFKRDDLIKLWMAQDYLNSKGNKDKGIIGDTFFDNLVARSFFQDFRIDDIDSGKIIGCKMHDIVHDFVQFLTHSECLIMDTRCDTSEMEVLGDKVRHLNLIESKDPLPLSTSSDNVKNIRTFIASSSKSVVLHSNFLLQLKCVRTLNLSDSSIVELPNEIGELIHMRHIDLSWNYKLEKLPNTICDLYHLCTLCLVGCEALEKLPDKMGKLINLQHLYICHCWDLEYLPKGIGRLKNLQTLDNKEVALQIGDNKEVALQIGDVGSLNLVQSISYLRLQGHVKDVSGVEKLQLLFKEQLSDLCLCLEYVDKPQTTSNSSNTEIEILNALRPHQDLKSLQIYFDTVITTWPRWIISLHNLRSLNLYRWKECEVLPPLGKLPSLERLNLYDMGSVKKVGAEFLGMGIEEDQTSSSASSSAMLLFPKLKSLHFQELSSWEEWEGVEAAQIGIMPCLSELRIVLCDKLNKLPDFLFRTPLRILEISSCKTLAERYKQGSGVEWPNISHIEHVDVSGRRRPDRSTDDGA